jgi:hypothetical protein
MGLTLPSAIRPRSSRVESRGGGVPMKGRRFWVRRRHRLSSLSFGMVSVKESVGRERFPCWLYWSEVYICAIRTTTQRLAEACPILRDRSLPNPLYRKLFYVNCRTPWRTPKTRTVLAALSLPITRPAAAGADTPPFSRLDVRLQSGFAAIKSRL